MANRRIWLLCCSAAQSPRALNLEEEGNYITTGQDEEQMPLARNYCKNTDKQVRKLGGESILEKTEARANILPYDRILSRKPS